MDDFFTVSDPPRHVAVTCRSCGVVFPVEVGRGQGDADATSIVPDRCRNCNPDAEHAQHGHIAG
jgi:transcription elongation factor Elf1